MKKNLIKKVFAVSLSIAMACAALPAANPVTASAAAPYVSLKTTFKTLKVAQTYKMTLKNNTINWKIKKVETTNKPIATVYGKTTSSVMIKGKSVGRATIRVRLATTKRKTKNTKTLRCRVNVIAADTPTTPVDPGTTTQTEATVTTQQELTDALAVNSIKKITIKPTSAVNFVIPSATYSDVDLIVDAPQSEVENSATFKSITVENIKPSTFTEKGSGNTFNWRAANGRLVVAKGASVRSVSITTANAKVAIDVQEGTLGAINVSAKVELNITGKLAEGAAAISISFTAAATDATLTTAIKAIVSTAAKIAAIFEAGAEDSTIKLETTGISVAVTNNTTKTITVTRNDNSTMTVRVGAKGQTVNSATSNGSGTWTPSGGGNSSGGGTIKPQTSNLINTTSAITVHVTDIIVTGSSTTVTNGSFKFTVYGASTVSPGAVEYIATVRSADDKFIASNGTWKKMDESATTYKVEDVSMSIPQNIDIETLKGCKLVIQFRAAEDNTYSGGIASVYEVNNVFSTVEVNGSSQNRFDLPGEWTK